MHFLFFFYAYVRHLYLPSFPTRRSSDLLFRAAAHRVWDDEGQHPRAGIRKTIHVPIDRNVKDRKSTRLNSSHVSISYAVFCLKKKMEVYILELMQVYRLQLERKFSRLNL